LHAPSSLNWTAHPLRQEPLFKSALLIAIIAGVVAMVVDAFGHALYGLVSLMVLTLSLARYFFPTRYALDEEGCQVQALLGFVRRYPWTQFRRADVHREGIFLSPFARPSRLDTFRGTFLKFHQNRDEVLYFVRRHVTDG
jgi:hypothetical protein